MILKRLFENDNSESISEKDLLNIIETQAQPFLSSSGGYLAYSGRTDKGDFFKGQYRTDRKPLGTNSKMNKVLNDYLMKQGLNLRSNSIFISSRKNTATRYGRPYIIFPLGEIKYHWYKDIPDLTVWIENREYFDPYEAFIYYYIEGIMTYQDIENNFFSFVTKDKQDNFIQKVTDHNYTEQQKIKILSDIISEEYTTGIPATNDRISYSLFNEAGDYAPYDYLMDKFSKEINIISDKPLSNHLKNGRIEEIVINSTDGYLAISEDMFLLHIFPKSQKLFNINDQIMQRLSYLNIELLSSLVPNFTDNLIEMYTKWINDLKTDDDEVLEMPTQYIKNMFNKTSTSVDNDKLREYYQEVYPSDRTIANLKIYISSNNDIRNEIINKITPLVNDSLIYKKLFKKTWGVLE